MPEGDERQEYETRTGTHYNQTFETEGRGDTRVHEATPRRSPDFRSPRGQRAVGQCVQMTKREPPSAKTLLQQNRLSKVRETKTFPDEQKLTALQEMCPEPGGQTETRGGCHWRPSKGERTGNGKASVLVPELSLWVLFSPRFRRPIRCCCGGVCFKQVSV